jgi:hypothetical protein
MINALHLLWIIPLTSFVSFIMAGMMHAASDADRRTEEFLKNNK